jgi:hypothetical protein
VSHSEFRDEEKTNQENMTKKAIFEGLIIDENDNQVEVAYVGEEPFYVVDDAGFRRHIPAQEVDHQILDSMINLVKEHEDLFTEQAAKMLGQEDIFSRAMIQNQLKNIDQQMERLFETGIPEAARQYMGMMGFRVVINLHGEVIRIEQPGMIDEEGE